MCDFAPRRSPIIFALVLTLNVATHTFSYAQTASFVAPPRTIADITAILDQQKPDPNVVAKLQAAADAMPPAGASNAALAKFYYDRGQAQLNLGRQNESIADAQQAIHYGEGSVDELQLGLMRQFLGFQLRGAGYPNKSIEVFLQIEHATTGPGAEARLANTYRQLVELYVILGDTNHAEAYVKKNQALIEQARHSPENIGYLRVSSESDAASAEGKLAEARGQFSDAETFYRQAEELRRQAATIPFPSAPPQSQQERAADIHAAALGRAEAREGKMAEGEADVRRALLNRLQVTGKYHLGTSEFIGELANSLVEQGRYAEAEKLVRSQIDILQTFSVAKSAQIYAKALSRLASILSLQDRLSEAAGIYAELDEATRDWEPARREELNLNAERILAFYGTNNLTAGIEAAKRLLTRQQARYGEDYVETALTRGLLALGLARAGRNADALREFKIAVPVLVASRGTAQSDDDDPASVAMREQRAQIVIESYMGLLAHNVGGSDAAAESLRLAEIIRGHSVQKALAAYSARMILRDPSLADLARKEQDLDKQADAQLGLLDNVLALPPDQREEQTISDLRAQIEKLHDERKAVLSEIEQRFPDYANLINPKPPSITDVQIALRPDEAFLSFYFGRGESFVWAVPKVGPVAFADLRVTAGDIKVKIDTLRRALEPNAATIGDIPPFDLKLAYSLYTLLLKPVETGWRPAKKLIVATNGALGLLPLSLLPTAPTVFNARAEPTFAGYRDVPWLARTHAVTIVPSAAAFWTLRQLPPGSDRRVPLVGFGDPYFSSKQAAIAIQSDPAFQAADAIATTRGVPLNRRPEPQTDGVNSAELSLLPRLPDTADELKSIALALQVDPSKVLYLGKEANVRNVESMDLAKFRVVAFATHGLIPGDLNGLTQPALALTAPEVAHVDGNGLLTMGDILSLKLDADWVVLSGCNTGSGAGAGAEAASGLARAFFYAGTRAVLVTNWSVDSVSARELDTDLFRRQAADPELTRSEALRRAMISLLDGPGFTDGAGKTVFSYAHPLFWAPYTIIGDGG